MLKPILGSFGGSKPGDENEMALLPPPGELAAVSAVPVACRAVSSNGNGLPTVVVIPEGPAKLPIVPMLVTLMGLVCWKLSPDPASPLAGL